jgi:hypothetical protein
VLTVTPARTPAPAPAQSGAAAAAAAAADDDDDDDDDDDEDDHTANESCDAVFRLGSYESPDDDVMIGEGAQFVEAGLSWLAARQQQYTLSLSQV